MRGVTQYAVFILVVSLVLAGFYFTVISSIFTREGFTYQYGTAPTRPIMATESSEGVTVTFRALEKGMIAVFSLSGEKLSEMPLGEYPAVVSIGRNTVALDDSSNTLLILNGKLERESSVLVDETAMRKVYATRSRILLPVKRDGKNALSFYDFELSKMNSAGLPATPVISGDVYAYAYEGSCYLGILEGNIIELPDCETIDVTSAKDIFVLVNGKTVIKFNRNLEEIKRTGFAFEGKYIASTTDVYVASDTQVVKYDASLNTLDCEACNSIRGSLILGFSDKGHYALTQKGPIASIVALN